MPAGRNANALAAIAAAINAAATRIFEDRTLLTPQSFEVRHDIGALVRAFEAKGHVVSGDDSFGIREPPVECRLVP